MPKVSKTEVDKKLRDEVFNDVFNCEGGPLYDWRKINDRQYGVLLIDANGEQRYIRLGAIVAELREDMTAEELMNAEIEAYHVKQAEKAEKERKRAEKAAADKAKREAKQKEQENDETASDS